jgi:hypothetical protein
MRSMRSKIIPLAKRPLNAVNENSLLKNALTKLISKEQCVPSSLLSYVSILVRNKTDTSKKDESTTQKQPKRSHTWPLLGREADPSLVV